MPGRSLATLAEQYPEIAKGTFDRVEVAVNAVLPGSDTHERYDGIEEVGLAAVIGIASMGQSYDPFDPNTPHRLSFMRNNERRRFGAWEIKPTDEEVLGGKIPVSIGRFTAYALAKINTLNSNSETSSHSPDGASIERGKVGVAGGRWLMRSLAAVSGLWEVHDHLTVGVLADEIVRDVQSGSPAKTADQLAESMEAQFAQIQRMHEGARAGDLTRDQVAALLKQIDEEIPVLSV